MNRAWLCIFGLVACGGEKRPAEVTRKTPEELKQTWGTKVQAKLERIVLAAKAAKGAELGTPGDAKVALDFDHDEKGHPNAIAVQGEDVESATEPRVEDKPLTHPRFSFQDDWQNHVYNAKALHGIEKHSPNTNEYVYQQFIDAKYLLVVTPGAVQWPNLTGGTFGPGSVALRAILVEIETAKPLGGFETTAHSSDEVRVNEQTQEATKRLDLDLLVETADALKDGIKQRWPGAGLPLHWGHKTY